MILNKETKLQQKEQEDEMLVSKQTGNLQEQCQDFKQIGNILGNKLSKLSMNLNSYCSIRLKLLHNLKGKSFHTSLMLNPEGHIKLLEENLNLLSKNCSSCNDYQLRSNSCSKPTSNSLILTDFHRESPAPSAYFKGRSELAIVNIMNRANEFPEDSKEIVSNNMIVANYKNDPFNLSLKKELVKDYHAPTLLQRKGRDDLLTDRGKRQNAHKRNYSNLSRSSAITTNSECIQANASNTSNDEDNQFEFTVEQEKIVSFVCSPSPERKRKVKQCTGDSNERISCSDQDSDELSELSLNESFTNSASEIVGNSLCTFDRTSKVNSSASAELTKHSTILWPPPPRKCSELPSAELPQTLRCFSSEKFTKVKPNQTTSILDNHGLGFPIRTLESRKRQKNFFNHETILFREASLRGCYDIENVLKGLRSPLPDVEQDLRGVKEAIFSAIRLQRSNDDMVLDSVTSVLDICKSWIKLNSHFEREEFKHALENHGIDISIFGDFLQWQCVSRILIDKLIHTLKKITSTQSSQSNFHGQSSIDPIGHVKQNTDNNKLRQEPAKCNDSYLDSTITHSSPSKNGFSLNKHWKQRRFLTNQSKQETSESKGKRLCKSKLTVSSSNNCQALLNRCNSEIIFGHGDNRPAFYDGDNGLHNMRHSVVSKSQGVVGAQSFLSCNSMLTHENGMAKGALDKHINFCNTQSKELYGPTEELNVCSVVHLNNLPHDSSPSASELQTNQYCPVSAFPTVPPFYGNQCFFMTPNQSNSNINQFSIKPNPIHCIDTDMSEKCIKSSYIKPGSYNPPQKPTNTQKTVNNNVPIEDIPVIGIPFICSSSQSSQQLKPQNTTSTVSLTQAQNSNQNCEISSDDTWRAALTLAESFRDTMMSAKVKGDHSLKLPDSGSFQSHFLLSDDSSQQSSDNHFKLGSETDDPLLGTAPDMSEKPIEDEAVSDAQIKTTNWVIESFNEVISDSRKELSINRFYNAPHDTQYRYDSIGPNDKQTESYQNDYESNSCSTRYFQSDDSYSEKMTALIVHQPKMELTQHFDRNNETYFTQRKLKKNKRNTDDNLTSYQQRSSGMYRKPKSVFKRAINKQIIEKLECILDHVWNTEVSNHFAPEKEATRLDQKIKSPMNVKAMKFKLANHSYDTLEQALVDFQQHFDDLKIKNQDNKECAAVINALEKTYLNLVETNFGLLCQQGEQLLGPIGKPPSLKPRRPKKISRRC